MSPVELVLGLVVGALLVILLYGLATRRIAWRQQGCCPADPALDARMRDVDVPSRARASSTRMDRHR